MKKRKRIVRGVVEETVECGYCERTVPIAQTHEREDMFFGGTFRVCYPACPEEGEKK